MGRRSEVSLKMCKEYVITDDTEIYDEMFGKSWLCPSCGNSPIYDQFIVVLKQILSLD